MTTTIYTDLRDCPECDGYDVRLQEVHYTTRPNYFRVVCMDCGLQNDGVCDTPEAAIAAWNGEEEDE